MLRNSLDPDSRSSGSGSGSGLRYLAGSGSETLHITVQQFKQNAPETWLVKFFFLHIISSKRGQIEICVVALMPVSPDQNCAKDNIFQFTQVNV